MRQDAAAVWEDGRVAAGPEPRDVLLCFCRLQNVNRCASLTLTPDVNCGLSPFHWSTVSLVSGSGAVLLLVLMTTPLGMCEATAGFAAVALLPRH